MLIMPYCMETWMRRYTCNCHQAFPIQMTLGVVNLKEAYMVWNKPPDNGSLSCLPLYYTLVSDRPSKILAFSSDKLQPAL
jgi:hypothetical protein